jgi:hypothetical protein
LLVSWCAGDRCDMVSSDEDHGRSRRPGVDECGWSSTGQVLSDRTVERSGDNVYGLYSTQGDLEREFLGLASKPRSMVYQLFDLKTIESGFPVWASKSEAIVW